LVDDEEDDREGDDGGGMIEREFHGNRGKRDQGKSGMVVARGLKWT
jgi:hypothetical protein